MTYTVIAVFLFMFLASAAFFPCTHFYREKKFFRGALTADVVMTIAGIALALSSHLVIASQISSAGDSSFESWASDMLDGWYSLILPTEAVLIGISLAAALTLLFSNHKSSGSSVFLRSAVLAASPAVPFIMAPFYGFMTDNSSVPLYPAILVSGIGFALVFRFAGLIGHIVFRKINCLSSDKPKK